MKTLRIVRNIAALFILMIALLALRLGVGVAHANPKACFFKVGYNCSIDKNGNCSSQKCTGASCNNAACSKSVPF